MTSTQFPQSTEQVARKVGANVRRQLQSQGRDLEWLAAETDITVPGILRAFSDGVTMGTLFVFAAALGVRPDALIEAGA